ncbi:MAG: type I methionyl aminopeptidase [Desulfobacteraceae bacterium]|nr:type I methionyl aminopeptidase [Desulfobacteraceae bacterium]
MGRSIYLKSAAEIRILREANRIVAETLSMLRDKIAPGVSTWELDQWAEAFAVERGAAPAFKGYRGFPGSLCVSLNEQVVHGIPSKKIILRDGDIISLDFGVKYNSFYGDAAVTLPVGKITSEKERLLDVTRESLYKGIEQAVPGKRINDISAAVQEHVERHGFSVVREYVGHGIGRQLHEAPEIPNYSRRESTPRIQAGMVFAIEPMVNLGGNAVKVLEDRWTVVTRDRSPSAHFEHSVAVTDDGPLILSELSH